MNSRRDATAFAEWKFLFCERRFVPVFLPVWTLMAVFPRLFSLLTGGFWWVRLGLSGGYWGLMERLLTGAFARAIDDKQRIAIPKRFREALLGTSGEEEGADSSRTTLYVAPGTDGSLAIYGEEAFASLADQLGGASPNSKDVRAFSRLFYARVQAVDPDKQGRIRIPTELAKLAELGAEAMLVGVRDHLEVWDSKRWQEYITGQEDKYDDLAERAFEDR